MAGGKVSGCDLPECRHLSAQAFPAFGHLVRNGQPDGGFEAAPLPPAGSAFAAERSGSAIGIAERSISV